MAWTATVNSKIITNGMLKVNVSFTDGTQTFTENFETRSGQDANWLNDNINRRITDLTSVIAFADTISTGVFTPTKAEVTPIEQTLTGKALYEYRLKLFEAMVSAIRKGIITDTNTSFVNLKNWLKNNFADEYIDLF